GLVYAGGKIFFADGSNNFYLSWVNTTDKKKPRAVGRIVPVSLNGAGGNIFFSDSLRNGSIFRLETEHGGPEKICGDNANHLHIVDGKIFYRSGGIWKCVGTDGGSPKEA
ncbi:MAG: DUF5050 domain-containing protein, partial [Defluviitaleaceae bacterium]|nr:DUF5050 domain-containing protein [Defluviitaleaceae bacterium]